MKAPPDNAPKMWGDDDPNRRCESMPPHPHLMPGWGCCKCRTYNGIMRTECKNCGHRRCDVKYDNDDKESN